MKETLKTVIKESFRFLFVIITLYIFSYIFGGWRKEIKIYVFLGILTVPYALLLVFIEEKIKKLESLISYLGIFLWVVVCVIVLYR